MIITGAILFAYGLLMATYFWQWKKVSEFRPPSVECTTRVSVVVAARNEEENLPLLVTDLRNQTYSSALFEVILVDDFSTDNTSLLAKSLPGNFKMITPSGDANTSSKKKAIAAGVKAATGSLMVITDADCRIPATWIETMAKFFETTGACFIAAPVKYRCSGSLLQVFQTLDFMMLQGVTAASVSAGLHNMCNGANLAYTKKAFETVNGFEGIDRLPTGDDMLLMHKIDKQFPGKVAYLKSEEGMVTTDPAPTWTAFFHQRIRWASKTMVYEDWKIISVLGFVLLLNIWFFVLIVFSIVHNYWLWWLTGFVIVKTALEFPFVKSVATFYGQQKLLKYFFILQPLHLVYTAVVGIWSQAGSYRWKERNFSKAGQTAN